MGKKTDMQAITEGVIWKQLLLFFFPILLGTLFQQLYTTVDTIIVGRAVGTGALAAVGATTALVNLFSGFFIGLSSGVTVVVSQAYGAKDREGVTRSVHTGMTLFVILGIFITFVGIFMGPMILRWTQVPESVYEPVCRLKYFPDTAPEGRHPACPRTVQNPGIPSVFRP